MVAANPVVTVNRTRRYLVIGVAVVAVGLLAAAAVVASRRQPDTFPVGTPEATVQAYFQALIDQRPLVAHDQLSPEIRDRCDPPSGAELAGQSITRVSLDEVTVDGDEATVTVSVTQNFDSSPFGLDESTTEQRVDLTRYDEGWRISVEPWPWFLCEREG